MTTRVIFLLYKWMLCVPPVKVNENSGVATSLEQGIVEQVQSYLLNPFSITEDSFRL